LEQKERAMAYEKGKDKYFFRRTWLIKKYF